jgi:hypothetical protein
VISICLLFVIAEIVPPMFADAVSIGRRITDYGFLEQHQEMLEEKNERINSPEILNETEERLDAMESYEIQPRDSLSDFSVETKGVPYLDPADRLPPILDASKRSTIWNKSTVIEFLLDRPLAYMMITFYNDTIAMTDGMLRQTLFLPPLDIGSDHGWRKIDIDNNASTGENGTGAEIRARMYFQLLDWDRPQGLEWLDPEITIEGTLMVEIERLVPTQLPLQFYLAKYASYEGKNFIISIGYHFDQVPELFNGSIQVKKIVIGNVARDLLESLRENGIGNISTGNVAEISGPYSVIYSSKDPLKHFEVYISMIRIENFTLHDWTWVKFDFKNKPGKTSIPLNGELWLNNTILYAPIDTVKWNAGIYDVRERIPFIFGIEFYETRETLVYAVGSIEDMPPYFRLTMDYTQKVDGKNITILEYEAEEIVSKVDYTIYEFPFYKSTGNIIDYNVSHILFRDLPLRFTFEVTSEVGRNLNDTISTDPSAGIMANFVDNVIIRIARRFYRIGESLRDLSMSITTLPARKGWAELSVDSGYIGQASIYRSSGLYLSMENDFISFLNQTNDEYYGYLVDFPIAAKLRDVSYMRASFKNNTELVLRSRGGKPVSIVFADGEDFAYAEFSNVPSEFSIVITDKQNIFSSYCIDSKNPGVDCDYSSPEAKNNRIDKFQFFSVSQGQYMEMEILDIPNYMVIEHYGNTIKFDTLEFDYVGEFNFLITDNSNYPVSKLIGEHSAFIDIQPEYSAASGRLTGLQHLTYVPGTDGKTELRLQKESELSIRMINNVRSSIDASIIIDPLPSHITMKLPGIINSSIQRFPDVVNVSGEVDFSNVVFAIANLGNNIIGIVNNMSQNVVELVGAVSTDLKFAYDLESYGSTLDLIARIERGPKGLIPALNWSHGIVMAAEELEDDFALKTNIYLQGLPPRANFTSRFGKNDIYMNVIFNNYRPKYDWLYVERRGLQSRNLDFYIDGLQPGLDLELEVNLTTNMTIGGRTEGMIDIQCFDYDTGKATDLGQMYVNLQKLGPGDFISNTEVYISEITSTFHIDISMFKNSRLNYMASDSIEFIYVDLAKKLNGNWYHSYLLFHELSTWFDVSMNSNPKYNINKPLPLQGMPELDIRSGSKTMDVIAHTSGRVSGQRGNYELQIENVNSLKGKSHEDFYRITSNGLDYLMIKITDMPLMENFKIHTLELYAENLRSMDFKVTTLFGVFPMFEISNLYGGALEIHIDHEMDIFGTRQRSTIALVDFTYTSFGGVDVPTETPVTNNGISIRMDSSKRHVLVPAPFTSLAVTTFT